MRRSRGIFHTIVVLCIWGFVAPVFAHAPDPLGGGNSGASTAARGELGPNLSTSWLSQATIRPRGTPLKITVENCSASLQAQITKYFQKQIAPQLSCLKKADQGWGKQSAALLLHILRTAPEITVTCTRTGGITLNGLPMSEEFSALSSHPEDSHFPAIDLNTVESKFIEIEQEGRLPSLLLHETLHWTGYRHYSNGPDLPYLGAMCCGRGNFDPQITSCDILNRDPALWDTFQTQRDFHNLLRIYNTPSEVQHTTLWNSYRRLMVRADAASLAEADQIAQLLKTATPEYPEFWEATRGRVPVVPHAQHLLGVWLRAALSGDHRLLDRYPKAHVSCVELALATLDLKRFLLAGNDKGTSADIRYLEQLERDCIPSY